MSAKTRGLARANAAAIAAIAIAHPTFSLAQTASSQKTTLPEISVTTSKPKPAKPKAAAAKPSPQPTLPAPPEQAPASTEAQAGQSETASNPGTPSAEVAPIMGAVGAPVGQTATSINVNKLNNEQLFSVTDVLRESPGVSMKQGNGPRDIGISIRGSNARNGFGIRNIVIMEDGFQVTQPDGLSRSDLIDPHAYSGIDVWRGPSSALFGNYATGGAINFRTRKGGEIDGIEYGSDVGSFGYFSNYVAAGTKAANFEGSVFLSDVRGDGHFGYSAFDTQTVNMLLSYKPTSKDTITIKGINNELDTKLPFRMSLNQYTQNPHQKGCATATGAAAGCVISNFSRSGNAATPTGGDIAPQTAEQAGANRGDRRTIGGFRWEHEFNSETSGRAQLVVDDRNISQPTGTTSAVGDYLSYNALAELSNRAVVGGVPATLTFGGFWNYLPVEGYTYIVQAGGGAQLGKLSTLQTGSTTNFGARIREEIGITGSLGVALGATIEKTLLEGKQTAYTYNVATGALTGTSLVSADREMTNVAPELSLIFKPNEIWQFRGRVAAGYGTPQFSNLFVQSDGQPGNNTDLQSQENTGYDLGVDWTPVRGTTLSLTGFYEFYQNEIVTQASPVNTGRSFSYNAPRSEHRGIEASADIMLTEGLRVSGTYLHNEQYYTEYVERVRTGVNSALFDREGNKIPGVSPNEVNVRLGYDQPTGPLKGLGTFVEYQWHEGFFMENQNILETPSYDVVNLNVHYATEFSTGPVRSFMAFFEVRNVLDETYISAANNISNSIGNTAASLANVGNSIYSGEPRAYYGGMKIKF